jgi:hypothetical protein
MSMHSKSPAEDSAVSVLTELAVEGTSSLVEAHRTLLDLAQQENDLVLKVLKDQVSGFVPAAATADFLRRNINTLVEMQQELLTATSKQTVQWLELGATSKPDRTAQLLEFAREGVECFARAQKKFLDAVSEESARAMSGKLVADNKVETLTDLKQLGCDAGNAFVEAQKRLLDIMSQQMNVNLNVADRTAGAISPSQLMPVAVLARDTVKSFFDAETALVGSLMKARKTPKVHQKKRRVGRVPRRRQTVVA